MRKKIRYLIISLPVFLFISSCDLFLSLTLVENNSNPSSNTDLSVYDIFVSTNGNDANVGTDSMHPLKSVQKAVDKAALFRQINIFIAKGNYTPGDGLASLSNGVIITNNNISIYGGCAEDFLSRNGFSVLNGTNGLYHIILASGVSSISIDGLLITGGNASGTGNCSYGGGIYFSNVSGSVITNSYICTNGGAFGGGLYLYGSSSNVISGNFLLNQAAVNGGGICLSNSRANQVLGEIYSNSAATSGGGIVLQRSENNVISADIYCNAYELNGGGICLIDSPFNTVTNSLIYSNTNNTTLYYGGGGIFLNPNSSNNTVVDCVIRGNVSQSGGGVYNQGNANIFNACSVYSNTSTYWNYGGGGLLIFGPGCQLINSEIYNNTSQKGGGGVYGGSLIVSNCLIFNNVTAGFGGGGVFLQNSNCKLISCIVTNNSSVNGVICLNPASGAIISNCIIGGTNESGYGIYEQNETANTTNHLLVNNVFLTNRMQCLYYDYNGVYAVTNNSSWTNINNITFSQALISTNTVTNL